MGIAASKSTYKKLNLSPEKIKTISVRPEVSDGKLLFNKSDKNHRYIIEEASFEEQD